MAEVVKKKHSYLMWDYIEAQSVVLRHPILLMDKLRQDGCCATTLEAQTGFL